MNTSTVISILLAGIFLHPNYLALNRAGEAVSFLGIPVKLATYSASAVPILLVVWHQSYIKKLAKKISLNHVNIFFVPLITFVILTPIALCGLGPLAQLLVTTWKWDLND